VTEAGSVSMRSGSTIGGTRATSRQVQRVLLAAGAVPDRGPRGDLAAGARRSWHGDEGLHARAA
jgi:hypothetical protein